MANDMNGGNLTNGTLSSLRFISLQPQLQQAGFAESLGLAARKRQTQQRIETASWLDKAVTVLSTDSSCQDADRFQGRKKLGRLLIPPLNDHMERKSHVTVSEERG
ncbi:TPA: hypothetical protein ACH3X2_007837 [Trebouxia sp. C0005]